MIKLKFIIPISVLFSLIFSSTVSAYSITNFASTGTLPFALTIDSSGNLYTSNFTSNDVSKITPAGASSILASTLPGTGPRGISVDLSGNVYTSNTNTLDASKITPSGASTIIGTTEVASYATVLDPSGNLYISNLASRSVSKITPGGISSVLASTLPGLDPTGIVVDSLGNIFTANNLSNDISKITPGGVSTIFATVGTAPVGMVIDSFDNLFVGNSVSNNVSKVTSAGVSTILAPTTGGTGVRGIVMDVLGNIYTANTGTNNVSKITPLGVSTIIGTTDVSPRGMAIDSLGNIYTSNTSTNNVSKITAPILTSVTPIGFTSDPTPDYTFNVLTDIPNTIIYGGSCSSATTVAILGNNTITLDALPDGTYSNCTIIVTDAFGPSATFSIPTFTIGPASTPPSSGGSHGGSGVIYCTDTITTFCRQRVEAPAVTVTPTPAPIVCEVNFLITDNMKIGNRDGRVGYYNRGIVTQVSKLQTYTNKLLKNKYTQAAGPIDGIYGPLTKQGVERLQGEFNIMGKSALPLKIDGIVGPYTKAAINNFCLVL